MINNMINNKNLWNINCPKCKKERIFSLKRFNDLNIGSGEDKGAKEYFQSINQQGYNFDTNTKFIEIGYIADGYDSINHVWCEFDTPYHNKPCIKEKDLIRQTNIIKYFESINKPLNQFIRVKADKNGDLIESICVYGQSNTLIFN